MHVRNLLRALVYEDDHEVALRVIGRNRVGDILQNRRLAGLWRGDDKRALALTNRHDEVNDAGGEDLRIRFQTQALIRVQRGQLIKVRALLCAFRINAVDGIDLHQLIVLAAVAAIAVRMRRAGNLDLTGNGVTRAQT